jgi:hypothetical protein
VSTTPALSEMTLLELCAGEGVCILLPKDREKIVLEAAILGTQMPAPVFRRPMVGSVKA